MGTPGLRGRVRSRSGSGASGASGLPLSMGCAFSYFDPFSAGGSDETYWHDGTWVVEVEFGCKV